MNPFPHVCAEQKPRPTVHEKPRAQRKVGGSWADTAVGQKRDIECANANSKADDSTWLQEMKMWDATVRDGTQAGEARYLALGFYRLLNRTLALDGREQSLNMREHGARRRRRGMTRGERAKQGSLP